MKMSIMVKVDDNLDFCQYFRKISILVYIFGIIELGQNFPQNFQKISIWVKIWKYVDLRQNL